MCHVFLGTIDTCSRNDRLRTMCIKVVEQSVSRTHTRSSLLAPFRGVIASSTVQLTVSDLDVDDSVDDRTSLHRCSEQIRRKAETQSQGTTGSRSRLTTSAQPPAAHSSPGGFFVRRGSCSPVGNTQLGAATMRSTRRRAV